MQLYQKYTTSDFFEFYDPWWTAPFTQKSLVSNESFQRLLNEIMGTKPFKRNLSMLAADLTNGQVVIFDETLPVSDRTQKIIASTSIPFAFEP